jgi:glycosyltransferase involved in cell wall biosynthesis
MRQIIYAWNYREWGGAQIYFMSLMKQAKKRYDVLALLPANSEQKLLQYLNEIEIPVEFLPATHEVRAGMGLRARLVRKYFAFASERRVVRDLLKRANLSEAIIHIDLGFWQSFAALARLSLATNVFTTVHTGLPVFTGFRSLRWKIKGKAISRFRRFHLMASNEDAKKSLQPYITADNYGSVEVAYSGFDPDEIASARTNKDPVTVVSLRSEMSNEKALVMALGQFIERKGCWVLLEALKQICKERNDLEFVWISTSRPNPQILKEVDQYGLGEMFRILAADEVGNTRVDLLSVLSIAEIFVLPSLQEGLPIALVEAMALGLPCIASNVNAVPEAIEHDVNGLLVPPNNAAALKAAIVDLLDDPARRQSFGAAAKTKAYERFNERNIAGRQMELYESAWKSGK